MASSTPTHIYDASANAQREFFDQQESELGQAVPLFLTQTSAVLEAATISAEPVALPKSERLFNTKRLPEGWAITLAQGTGKRRDPGSGSATRRKTVEKELLTSLYSHARTRKYVAMLMWHNQQRPQQQDEAPEHAAKRAQEFVDQHGAALPIATLESATTIRL